MAEVLRYAAFVDPRHPDGGNPAGVILDAAGMTDAAMQRVAADLGYAESAFVTGRRADGARVIRYFSPIAEVPFCGHATIATAVAIAGSEGAGPLVFATAVGPVEVEVVHADGRLRAAFTSVEPSVQTPGPGVVARLLALLGLHPGDLDPEHPPRIAFAGNRHPVLVIADGRVFDAFVFDPDAVRALMDEQGWAGTVTVVWRRGEDEWEARNLFPVGAIAEDPATGSAAASFGGYLRELGRVSPPARVRVRQGRHVGRPSLLLVDIPAAGGITVSGTAAAIR